MSRLLGPRTINPGPFGIPIIEEPSLPDGTVLVIGSCGCKHSVGSHNQTGCDAGNCDCDTPLSRLVKRIRIDEEQP